MLTKEQALENHRRLWRHIAEKTRAEKRRVNKREAFKDIWGDVWVANGCWCCKYDAQFDSYSCTHCPVMWGNGKYDDCWCDNSEYREWRNTCKDKDWEKAAELAEKIANLPEREGV